MAKALKVPIHVDAIVVGSDKSKTDSGSNEGWAPPILVGNHKQLFLTASQGLEPGVHLHWALPDALCRAEENFEGTKSEFFSVPDLWLVIRHLPAKKDAKRKLVVWVVDSISGRKYVLQQPASPPRPPTKRPRRETRRKQPISKRKPIAKADRDSLVAVMETPKLSDREVKLVSAAINRNWMISVNHQALLEQLLERVRPHLGTPLESLDKLEREPAPGRLTAAGFQNRETGEFDQVNAEDKEDIDPEILDDPLYGPMWAAYYPNARNRFGMHDPLTDLGPGDGPVSYTVVGWYLDEDDDPLHDAGNSIARDQFIKSCNWDYSKPSRTRLPGLFERRPRLHKDQLKQYIDEIEKVIDKITPDELIEEIINGRGGDFPGGLPGDIDPIPDHILEGVPELPREVLEDTMPGRNPAVVRAGAEAFDLAFGQGRELTKYMEDRRQLLDKSTRTRRRAPRRRGELESGRLATSRSMIRQPSLRQPRTAIRQPVTTSRNVRLRERERLIRDSMVGKSPTTTRTSSKTVNRKLAGGETKTALAILVNRKASLLNLGGVRAAELLGNLADINIGVELRPDFGPVAGQLFTSPAPTRLVCHGSVLGVSVKGSEGLYVGASEGIWGASGDDPKQVEAVMGSSYASAVADEIASSENNKVLIEALHAGLQDKLTSASGAERMPQLLHQNGFASSHLGDSSRVRALLLIPGADEGQVVEIDEDAERPGKAEHLGNLSSWEVDKVEVVEIRPAAADKRLAMRWIGDISPVQTGSDSPPSSLALTGGQWSQRKLRIIEEPPVRWWRPNDPIILLEGGRRGTRHGNDGVFDPTRVDRNGRFEPDGLLACRTTGQTVYENSLDALQEIAAETPESSDDFPKGKAVRGSDLLELGDFLDDIEDLTLRQTVREIVEEAALLDPSNKERMARVWTEGEDNATIAARFQTHCEAWRMLYYRDANKEEVEKLLSFGGKLPSIIAIKFKEPAWSPIMAEYEVVFRPAKQLNAALTTNWTLENVEHEPKSGALDTPSSSERVYSGRAFPTPAAAVSFAESIQNAVADSPDESLRADAAKIAEDIEMLDMMGFSIPDIDETVAEANATYAGRLRIERVRLIDTFGQVLTVRDNKLKVARDDLSPESQLRTPSTHKMLVRPRLPYFAQLHFRFMSASDPNREARPWLSPVCGYLLPDHVEHAIEVFDSQGRALGQIRHQTRRDKRVIWNPAPGVEPRLGEEAASIENPYLRAVIQGILNYNAGLVTDALADMQAAAEATATTEDDNPTAREAAESIDESALSAMIRAIDTVQDTVDRRVGRNEFVSTLVGRPVAVVRAKIGLKVALPEGTPPPQGIEARLGALTQTDDGLFGYFVDGDTMRFHPPHGAVLTKAAPALDDPGGAPDPQIREITHEYVMPDPTVDLPLNETVELIMLMDPHSGVHATTGVLPRKRLMLERAHYEEALARIAPTFKVGPVLLNPQTKAMPVPGLERFDWVWTRREQPASGADGWSVSEVGLLPDSAVLPTEPLQVHEGWLRLMLDDDRPEEDAAE